MFDHVHGTQDDMLPRIKDGRTFWYRKTLFFTKDEFADGYTGSYWRQVTQTHRINNYGATYEIAKTIDKWCQLLKRYPTFTGGNDAHYFKRLNPENCTFYQDYVRGYSTQVVDAR